VSLSKAYLVNNVNKLGIGVPAGAQFAAVPNIEYYTQKLDHFDPTNQNTWQQVRALLQFEM